MLKNIAFVAFAAVAASALAQTTTQQTTTTTTDNQGMVTNQSTTTTTWADGYDGTWRQKYDTYHIGSTDINSLNPWEMLRVARWNLRQGNATDAYNITEFLNQIPSDQEYVIVKALANNYKQASMVRDEVAMARWGSAPTDYAWLGYPPLTWSDTPGQNSWSNLTFNNNGTTTTTTTTMTDNSWDNAIAMTDDASRPMRMMMAHKWGGDLNYYTAVDILGSGLDNTDRGVLAEIFHPRQDDPNSFSNEAVLDSIIHVIKSNAMMVHGLGQFSWYNHFRPDYYTTVYQW
jgi:hypothetical protein